MIGTRDDLDLDWETVYRAAARTGTVLEMNGSPHRLDLSVERARKALELGCLLSIDSDAHHTREFSYLGWGISQARRAWVEPADVLNTRSRADLLAWLAAEAARTVAQLASTGRAYHPRREGRVRGARPRDRASAWSSRCRASRRIRSSGRSPWSCSPACSSARLQVVGGGRSRAGQGAGVAVESLILPGAAALAALGAIRLVPIGVVLAARVRARRAASSGSRS